VLLPDDARRIYDEEFNLEKTLRDWKRRKEEDASLSIALESAKETFKMVPAKVVTTTDTSKKKPEKRATKPVKKAATKAVKKAVKKAAKK
jgi:Ni,Fe-hydrogenase maturation factor